jgi:hypothetical protein
VRAGDGNRTRMTSLEDRYGSNSLDVLRHRYWSRASDDPLLTVTASGSSWHLARTWPTLRHQRQRGPTAEDDRHGDRAFLLEVR